MKKHEIFDHLVDTFLYMGQKSGFEKADEQDKYVFSQCGNGLAARSPCSCQKFK